VAFRDLLIKYNVPAPRYTSYPTVPYWEDSPSEEQWLDSLKVGSDAALYLHIPFCEQLCTFCGCNTRITKNHDLGLPYVDALLQEWQLYLKHFREPFLLRELHLGGGTPTFLSPPELSRLMDGLFKHLKTSPKMECSVEVDPRVTSLDHLKTLGDYGFKRISLGVQDFSPVVQHFVNRIQSVEMVATMTEMARTLGYHSVNFDLIYGLPGQNLVTIKDTFHKVINLRPDRIAFYGYAHVPWIKPAHRRFKDDDLPGPDLKRDLYETGRTMLLDAGYVEIGMDHFALKTDSLWQAVEDKTLHRNFMGYMSDHVSPLLGLGVSAISDSWDIFSQNEKVLEVYLQRIKKGELPLHRGHVLTDEDKKMRRHILDLMTRFETQVVDNDFLNYLKDRGSELEKDGLMRFEDNRLLVCKPAFIRNVAMLFDMRLKRKEPETRIFSQSI
jgi:oxygen-independent coproporphyrinogen III oxidase